LINDVVRGEDNDAGVLGFESYLLVSADVVEITAQCTVTNGGGSSSTSGDGAESTLVLD
jgi:hypothetical protein